MRAIASGRWIHVDFGTVELIFDGGAPLMLIDRKEKLAWYEGMLESDQLSHWIGGELVLHMTSRRELERKIRSVLKEGL